MSREVADKPRSLLDLTKVFNLGMKGSIATN